MTTDEVIIDLQRQVAEADAARRHAQEVSSELVQEKRALQAELAEAKHSAWIHSEVVLLLHREKKEIQDALAQRLRDLEEVCQTESELRAELSNLRGLAGQFIEAWDHDGEPNAAAYEDVVEKARRILTGVKQNHSVDANKMVAPETIASVTTWANETFGPATIEVQIDRAWKEFRELLQLRGLDTDKIAEEAADVCICLFRVIGTLDPEAINKKMAKNRARKWQVDGQGCAQHVGE